MGAYLNDRDLEKAEEMVGGRFKLTALLQRRVQELIRNLDRTQSSYDPRNPIEQALAEVLEGKIELVADEELPRLEGEATTTIFPGLAEKKPLGEDALSMSAADAPPASAPDTAPPPPATS